MTTNHTVVPDHRMNWRRLLLTAGPVHTVADSGRHNISHHIAAPPLMLARDSNHTIDTIPTV